MGDEERRCLAAGLCGGQQGGWQTKTERYSSSDMETGSMRAPKLNTQHQQPSFPDAEVAQSSTILGKSWASRDSPAVTGCCSPLQGPNSTTTCESGTRLPGAAGMGAHLQTSIPRRAQNTREPPANELRPSRTTRTTQPRTDGEGTPCPGSEATSPPSLDTVWFLQKPLPCGRPQRTAGSREARTTLAEAKRATFFCYSYSQGSV